MRPNLRERFFKGGFHLSRGRFFGYTSRHIRKMPLEILCSGSAADRARGQLS
jgi:hypothetical protein